jgi:hypothetical protein
MSERDLLAEIFARVENARERAVLYGVFRLRAELTRAALEEALVAVARRTPKLGATPRVVAGELRWVDALPAEELPKRVILDEAPSDEAALAFPLTLGDGPVLRLALRSPTELLVILHHALSDWFGIRWLVGALSGQDAPTHVAPLPSPPWRRVAPAMARLLRARSVRARDPPVILGAKSRPRT